MDLIYNILNADLRDALGSAGEPRSMVRSRKEYIEVISEYNSEDGLGLVADQIEEMADEALKRGKARLKEYHRMIKEIGRKLEGI